MLTTCVDRTKFGFQSNPASPILASGSVPLIFLTFVGGGGIPKFLLLFGFPLAKASLLALLIAFSSSEINNV